MKMGQKALRNIPSIISVGTRRITIDFNINQILLSTGSEKIRFQKLYKRILKVGIKVIISERRLSDNVIGR